MHVNEVKAKTKYVMDGTDIVEVLEVREKGWVAVKREDGMVVSILSSRLTPIQDGKLELDKIIDEIIKPKPKTTRVEISIDNGDGTKTIKVLEGEDASLWAKYVRDVSVFADTHNANPPFENLKWRTWVYKVRK